MTARIHHYVPQLYLRGFCRDPKRPTLFVVDAIEKRTFETSPRNVAAERDFNRINIDGFAPDKLEMDLAKFEGEVAAAISRISDRKTFRDAEDRAVVLNLLGLMALRNPRQRDKLDDFQSRTAKMMLSLIVETPERWAAQIARAKAAGYIKAEADDLYEKVKAFVKRGEFDIPMARERHIALELSTFDKILPFLFERKWTLLRAHHDSGGFVTSDHPVCLMWTDPKMHGGFYGPGFGLTKTAVLFPLTMELALVGTFEGYEGEMDAHVFNVAQCNATTIGFAERQIYAAGADFPYWRQGPSPCAVGEELLGDGSFVRPRVDDH